MKCLKVKELMEALKRLDPEREILIEDYDESCVKIKGVSTRVLLPSGICFCAIEMEYED